MPGVPTKSYGNKVTHPWRQFISNKGWMGDANFDSQGGKSSAVIVIDVPWDKYKEVVGQVLGSSKADGKKISRITPMQHPIHANMRAVRITSIQGVGTIDDIKGIVGSVQNYQIARMTIQYDALPYQVTDDNPGQLQEHLRYTEVLRKPAAEYVAIDTPLTFHPAFAIAGGATKFTGKHGLLLVKEKVQVIHHQVPADGHLSTNGRPTKIQDGYGRVNSVSIFGYPPGTLLMEACDAQPYGNVTTLEGGLAIYYKVTHNWLYFDPPRGNYVGTTFGLRGHNTKPQKRDGLFYPVVLEDGTEQYKPYDFTRVFEMNTD